MAAPSADRINKRAAKDRAFLKRALKNPGLRAKLDPKYLSGGQRKARALNTRLNAPITPGSSTTERDLAHAAQAATTVRYGPQEQELGQQLGVAQTTERDTGSFYDQYLQSLREHQSNVAAFQQGAQQALAQTASGITGLSGAQGADLQAQANQAAQQQGVTPAGNLGQMASDATAIRQALMGGIQGEQAMQGAAANTFADTQARVVGPGQKLAAQAQARGRTGDVRKQIRGLKTEEGAFNQSFRDTRRQDEFKNVLAQQTLGANVANQQADNAIAATNAQTATTRVTETQRHNRAGERTARARVRQQQQKAADSAAAAATKRATTGPFAGLTQAQITALTPKQAQQKVDDYNANKGSGGKPKGKGPEWKTSEAMSRGMTQAKSLKNYADKAKRGEAFVAGHQPSGPLPRNGPNSASAKIQQAVAAPDDPILVTAALDAAYDGRLSAATVRKLIAAGYKPSRVAATLGVPTAGGRRTTTSRTTRPGEGPATARR